MDNYEIRIEKSGAGSVILAGTQCSDHAAVRRALSCARAQDGVEVWRGDVCIYARQGAPRAPLKQLQPRDVPQLMRVAAY